MRYYSSLHRTCLSPSARPTAAKRKRQQGTHTYKPGTIECASLHSQNDELTKWRRPARADLDLPRDSSRLARGWSGCCFRAVASHSQAAVFRALRASLRLWASPTHFAAEETWPSRIYSALAPLRGALHPRWPRSEGHCFPCKLKLIKQRTKCEQL